MELSDLTNSIKDFNSWTHVQKVKLFAWVIHTYKKQARFQPADVLSCYDTLHLERPSNLSAQLGQLNSKKPKEMLKDSKGYYLEKRVLEAMNRAYGERQVTIQLHEQLAALPGKVSSEAERLFLHEAIACYRAKAFRAAIVMVWNLAYDHLLEWIVATQLVKFNANIAVRYPKMINIAVVKKEDFSDNFKENEVIEICGTAGIITNNLKKILNEKLTRRNLAAHPSLIEIIQFQAEDAISDLVNNVVLKLV